MIYSIIGLIVYSIMGLGVYLALRLREKCEKEYTLIPKDYKGKKICFALCILFALPIIAYPLTLIADIMLFDAPGSEYNVLTWLIFTLLVFYPVPLLAIDLLIIHLFKRHYLRNIKDDKV